MMPQKEFIPRDRRVSPSFKNAIRHPPCVAFLVHQGIPADVGEGDAIDILVAYAVAKGLNAAQSEKLAQQMAERTARCTDAAQVVRRFRERLMAVQSAGDHWNWDCRRVWASREFIKRGACTGWSCPYYDYASVQAPSAEGITRSDADDQRERDVLAYVLNVPEGMDEALREDVPPGAFGAEYTCRDGTTVLLNRALWHVFRDLAGRGDAVRTNTIIAALSRVEVMKPLLRETARYLDGVSAETPCPRDAFLKALKRLKERETRLRGREFLHRADAALQTPDVPLEITLGALVADVDALKRAAGDNEAIRPLEGDLGDLVQALFTTRRPVMPTPSAWLNDALGGGWEPGKLYVVCGVSDKADNAATDFCAWCAEYAAHRWFPVLYASYRMSKEELGVRTLARHGGIEAEAIVKRQWNALDPDEGARLQRRVIETMESLNRRIARTLTIVEADGTTTVAALASAVQTMRNRAADTHNDRGRDAERKPALMVIDGLHLMPIERDGARTWVSDEASRWTLIRLKQCAREGKMAIVVLCAAPRPRACDPPTTGTLSAGQIAASFRGPSVVDGVLVVQTDEVTNEASGGENGGTTDQFHRVWDGYRRRFPRNREEIDRRFSEALGDHPPDALTSGYACVSVFNDRANDRAEVPACPLFIYESPYHRFTPVEVDLSVVGEGDGEEGDRLETDR